MNPIPKLLAVVCALLCAANVRADEETRPPNVVVFLVDDLGWSDVGCYGNGFHETPNIDRLAADGMKFTDAYAACPVCSPTRASIVTGRYPASVNVTDFISGHWRPWAKTIVPRFHFHLPHEETTFAEALKPAGYVSGAFGKWHLGGPEHFPGTQGFDEWIVTRGRHFAPNFRTTAGEPFEPKPDEYLADYLTRRAEKFLEDHRDEPFALYLPHYAVHIPLEAEQRLIRKYERKRLDPKFRASLRIAVEQPGTTAAELEKSVVPLSKNVLGTPEVEQVRWRIDAGRATVDVHLHHAADVEPARAKAEELVAAFAAGRDGRTAELRVTAINNPIYAAMVEHVDESLGRIVKTLADLGLAENTILVFTSDNGGLYRRFDDDGASVSTQAPLRDEKGSLYEGGVRVPCIVRWPGVTKPGSVSREPISSVDVLPTMLEAAGLEVPANVDGTSLVPLLNGGESLQREAIYWHYPHYHHTKPAGAVRAGRFKLIEFFEEGRLELYDLVDDRGEHRNLIGQRPETAIELRKKLAAWRERVGAKMPTPNPDYDEAKAHLWGNKRDRGF